MKRIFKILVFLVILFGSTLLYCFYNYQFWTHYKTDNFKTLVECQGENIRGLRGRQILIHKDFEPHIEKINEYATNNNVELIINQAYRSSKQTLNRVVAEPAKQSNHLAGFAIDFNIISNDIKYFSNDLRRNNLTKLPKNIQDFIADIRKDKDLRWGGDFRKEDPVHIDNPINLKSKNVWREYSNLCTEDYDVRVYKWEVWR